MKPLFTFDEIRTIEKNIIEQDNIPSIILMENAGKNSCDFLIDKVKDLSLYSIFIICGKGNNAGDGFTLARHILIKGYAVKVFCISGIESLKGDALINYNLLAKMNSELSEIILLNDDNEFEKYVNGCLNNSKKSAGKVLIIDAILGTGIKGKLDNRILNFINSINTLKKSYRSKIKVISLDIPSGLMSGEQINPLVKADCTISMGTNKAELMFDEGKENSGKVSVVPIGITDDLLSSRNTYGKKIIEFDNIVKMFPLRKKTSHKYSNGKLLVIGGSRALSGALAMSCLSAVKSGAGGVVAAIPDSIFNLLSSKYFDIMKLPLLSNEEGCITKQSLTQLTKRLEWADTVLIGPGLSTNNDSKEFLLDFIFNCHKNLVIDADGLTNLSDKVEILKKRKFNNKIILTPHLGEFSRLSNSAITDVKQNRFEFVRRFSEEYKVNIVLKSETSLSCIYDTNDFYNLSDIILNSTGNELLATAGSGDILSGLIASILSQTNEPAAAMICGNYIHGLCAELFYEKYKNKQSAKPSDIMNYIPKAISKLIN
jgi:ADP-dependent NAD(P)H-hydrate dehydratase / NAD(P)H-hydrate epimerase